MRRAWHGSKASQHGDAMNDTAKIQILRHRITLLRERLELVGPYAPFEQLLAETETALREIEQRREQPTK